MFSKHRNDTLVYQENFSAELPFFFIHLEIRQIDLVFP